MASYSTILNNLQLWDQAANTTRVAIAKAIAQKLGPDYMYIGFKRYTAGGQTHEIMAVEHQPTMMVFMIIPGGTFMMGNSYGERAICEKNKWTGDIAETPSHEVELRAFMLSEFVTTEFAYRAAFPELAGKPWEIGEDHPKEAVSRTQAMNWCKHFGFRLPTEAEWEYACRAGTETVFFWGDDPDPSYAWMLDNYDYPDQEEYRNHTAQEHRNRTNAFGLIDMLGNLSEWVRDDSHLYYDHDHNTGYYLSDERNSDGILRGGCFQYNWKFLRCATRIACADYGDTGIGFRPAAQLPIVEGSEEATASEIGKSQRAGHSPAAEPPKASQAAPKKPWWKVW